MTTPAANEPRTPDTRTRPTPDGPGLRERLAALGLDWALPLAGTFQGMISPSNWHISEFAYEGRDQASIQYISCEAMDKEDAVRIVDAINTTPALLTALADAVEALAEVESIVMLVKQAKFPPELVLKQHLGHLITVLAKQDNALTRLRAGGDALMGGR